MFGFSNICYNWSCSFYKIILSLAVEAEMQLTSGWGFLLLVSFFLCRYTSFWICQSPGIHYCTLMSSWTKHEGSWLIHAFQVAEKVVTVPNMMFSYRCLLICILLTLLLECFWFHDIEQVSLAYQTVLFMH